jgi:hypothetical protein
MNKLLSRTLQLAGVLLEAEETVVVTDEAKKDETSPTETTDDTTEKKEPEEKKDEPKEEPKTEEGDLGAVADFISSTYTELREKTWGFVDSLFDKFAEEFGEDLCNLIINNTSKEDLTDLPEAKDFATKLAEIKTWFEANKEGKGTEEKKEEPKTDDKEEKKDVDTSSLDIDEDSDLDKTLDKMLAK